MKFKDLICISKKENNIFLLGAFFVVIATAFFLHYLFGPIDMSFPISYSGDSLFSLNEIRLILEGDHQFLSIPKSSRLGFPFGYDQFYFPIPDIGFWIMVRLCSLFTSNVFLIFNFLCVLSFYLAALGMYIILYFFKMNKLVSISISLIFTFLYFHFSRIPHFHYIFYFYLPFLVYIALKIWDIESFFYRREGKKYKLNLDKKTIFTLVLLCFISGINFYYAFFSVFLMSIAAFAAFCQYRNRVVLWSSGLVLGAIVLSFLLGYSPYLIEKYNNPYATSVIRDSSNALGHGLKISDLVLPIIDHRIPFFAKIKALVKNHPLTAENTLAGLGVVGSFGFLILIGVLLAGRNKSSFLGKLSILNIGLVLLATIGGFSHLFAMFISPNIRGYNRISIFIAVISLFAIAKILTSIFKRINIFIQIVVLIPLTIFAIFDQTTKNSTLHPNAATKEKFISDRDFVSEIENCIDNGQAVYQYPHISYFGSAIPQKLRGHKQLIETLHSTKVQWTCGSVIDTKSDAYHLHLASLPLKDQMDYIANSLYAGIIVYNLAFEDNGKQVSKFTTDNYDILKTITSKDGTKVFYKFKPSNKKSCFNFSKFNNFWGQAWAKGNSFIEIYCACSECSSITFELDTFIARNVSIIMNGKEKLNLSLKPRQPQFIALSGLEKSLNILDLRTDKPAETPNQRDGRKVSFIIKNFKILSHLHCGCVGGHCLWRASELPTRIGEKTDDGAMQKKDKSQSGYLTFGPCLQLPSGQYTFEIAYTSSAINGDPVGEWDVVHHTSKKIELFIKGPISGTEGAIEKISGQFTIDAEHHMEKVEIRTAVRANVDLKVFNIRVERVQ